MYTKGSSSNDDDDLVGSLEEFGLSKYEARAYLTMIGKGSLAASEIAYYANLPRTKIYPTLKKLEKKRLSIISQQKPLICSAIPPEEAFNDIVNLHVRRLKNMKKIIDKLQRLNDIGQKFKSSEERRYFVLNPNSALEKVGNLIANSRSSINAILDLWGLRLITQCKASLIKAITNGVEIRLILANQCIGNESVFLLPGGIDLKVGEVFSNMIIIDSNNVISVDSNNGKAAIFTSMDVFGSSQVRNFEEEWNNTIEIRHLSDTDPTIALKATQLTKIVERNGLLSAHIFRHAINLYTDSTTAFIKEIERSGIKISDMNTDEIFNIVDSALRMSYSGSLNHDKSNNIISIQSKVNGKTPLPWAFLLASYFKHIGNESKIIQDSIQGLNAETIHIKLSKAIP